MARGRKPKTLTTAPQIFEPIRPSKKGELAWMNQAYPSDDLLSEYNDVVANTFAAGFFTGSKTPNISEVVYWAAQNAYAVHYTRMGCFYIIATISDGITNYVNNGRGMDLLLGSIESNILPKVSGSPLNDNMAWQRPASAARISDAVQTAMANSNVIIKEGANKVFIIYDFKSLLGDISKIENSIYPIMSRKAVIEWADNYTNANPESGYLDTVTTLKSLYVSAVGLAANLNFEYFGQDANKQGLAHLPLKNTYDIRYSTVDRLAALSKEQTVDILPLLREKYENINDIFKIIDEFKPKFSLDTAGKDVPPELKSRVTEESATLMGYGVHRLGSDSHINTMMRKLSNPDTESIDKPHAVLTNGMSFSVHYILPKKMAYFVSQSTDKLSKSRLLFWVKSLHHAALLAQWKTAPSYILPTSSLVQRQSGIVKNRVNDRGLLVDKDGDVSWQANIAGDLTQAYENTLENAIRLSYKMGIPFNATRTTVDSAVLVTDPESSKELTEAVKSLGKYTYTPLALAYDHNVVVRTRADNPGEIIISHDPSSVALDVRSIDEELNSEVPKWLEDRNIKMSMRDIFSSDDSPLKRCIALYTLLASKGTLPDPNKLLKQVFAEKHIKLSTDSSLDAYIDDAGVIGSDSIDYGTYNGIISAQGDIISGGYYDSDSNYTKEYSLSSPAALASATSSIISIIKRASENAGNYRFHMHRHVGDRIDFSLEDVEEYVNFEFFKDWAKYKNYIGGSFALKMVNLLVDHFQQPIDKALSSVNAAELTAIGITASRLRQQIMPFATLVGPYSADAKNISDKARKLRTDGRVQPTDKLTDLDDAYTKVLTLPGVKNLAMFPHQVEVSRILDRVSDIDIPEGETSAGILDVSPGGGKCEVGDTLVPTSQGILRLDEIRAASGKDLTNGFKEKQITVCSTDGFSETNSTYARTGVTHSVWFTDGSENEGLPDHKLWVLNTDTHVLEFKRLDEIQPGNWLPRAIGTRLFTNQVPSLPTINPTDYSHAVQTNFAGLGVTLPTDLTMELAEFIGLMVAEGHIPTSSDIITFSQHNAEVMDYFLGLYETIFDCQVGVPSKPEFRFSGQIMVDFVRSIIDQGLSADRNVPLVIRQSPEAYQLAFLRGLFEGDGSIYIRGKKEEGTRWVIDICTISWELTRQTKALLDNIGIGSTIRHGYAWATNGTENQVKKPKYTLTIDRCDHTIFAEKIGFISSAKRSKLNDCVNHIRWLDEEARQHTNPLVHGHFNKVPVGGLVIKLLNRINEIGKTYPYDVAFGNQTRTCYYTVGTLAKLAGYTGNFAVTNNSVVRYTIRSLARVVNAAPIELSQSIKTDSVCSSLWNTIRYLETYRWTQMDYGYAHKGEKPVYDLGVPGPHNYVVNGLYGHNTFSILTDALNLLSKKKIQKPLIICPGSIAPDWVNAVAKLSGETKSGTGDFNAFVLNSEIYRVWGEEVLLKKLKSLPINTFVIATDSFLATGIFSVSIYGKDIPIYDRIDKIMKIGFDYVALDESHRAKNPKSLRSQAIQRVMNYKSVKYIRLASGTLVHDNLRDLLGQLRLVNPYILKSLEDFKQEHTYPDGTLKPTAADSLRRRIGDYTTIYTAKKRKWAFLLPSYVDNFFAIPMAEEYRVIYLLIIDKAMETLKNGTPEQKRIYALLTNTDVGDVSEEEKMAELSAASMADNFPLNRLEQFLMNPDEDPLGKASANKLPKPAKIYDPKNGVIARLKAHFAEPAENPNANKVLVFCRYKSSARAVFNALQETEFAKNVVYYDASNTEGLDSFLEDPNVTIMAAVEQSINTGKNLQIASRIIRVEMPWSPGDLDQASARIMRPSVPSINKDGSVTMGKFHREKIYMDWLLAEGSLEIGKFALLTSKMVHNAKFDEAGNPSYADIIPPPPIAMNLDTLRNYVTLEHLGVNSEGRLVPGSHLEAYSKLKYAEKADFDNERKTSLNQLVPVKIGSHLPGSKKVEGLPIIFQDGSIVRPLTGRKPGRPATVVQPEIPEPKATLPPQEETPAPKRPVGRPPKVRLPEETPVPKRPVGRPPKVILPEEVPAPKRPVGRPPKVILPEETNDFDKYHGNPNVKKDFIITAYLEIINGMYALSIVEGDLDIATPRGKDMLRDVGFVRVGRSVATKIETKRELALSILALKANFPQIPEWSLSAMRYFIDHFESGKIRPEGAKFEEVRNFFLSHRTKNPNIESIEVYPVVYLQDLYLIADRGAQLSGQLLANKRILPQAPTVVWEKEEPYHVLLTLKKPDILNAIRKIKRYGYRIANNNDILKSYMEIQTTAPASKEESK